MIYGTNEERKQKQDEYIMEYDDMEHGDDFSYVYISS